KLSNILFTNELARRIKAAGIEGITAAACHPGVTATNLATASTANSKSWLWWLVYKMTDLAPRQSCPMGALPTLYAATGREVEGGDFFGPKHFKTFGYPVREDPSEQSKSETECLFSRLPSILISFIRSSAKNFKLHSIQHGGIRSYIEAPVTANPSSWLADGAVRWVESGANLQMGSRG
ncbi:hypothetical protein PC114_g21386, partial [Phytophthora cactorum]